MRIVGVQNIVHRNLKINPTSIWKGNIEYIIAQKDHKRRHQKRDFFSMVDSFRINLSYS